jgi:acyl-CoA synthetase (AMP-forming)/AMP-acid ligase II
MYSLPDLIRYRGRTTPDIVAIWFEGRQQTYRELDRRASQVANALIARGVKPGDRVCVLDQNSDLQIELIFGIAKAGAVLVPVNWRLAAREVRQVVDDAEAVMLFAGGPFVAIAQQIQGDLTTVRHIITFDTGPDEWERYAAIRDAEPGSDPWVPIVATDTVWQVYTSGTTGAPKGAEIMTCNILPPYIGALSWIGLRESDVILVAFPLYHVTGSAWALLGIIAGATLIVMREFHPAKLLLAAQEHKVNHMVLVPAAMLFVLQAADQIKPDLSSLRTILYAASPIPEALLRRALAYFKCDFVQAYGLTETSGGIAILAARDHQLDGPHPNRLKSAGQAVLGSDVKVVDADGKECAPGQMGEIIIRGPLVMKGYWKNPEATGQAIRDGWFYSGDAGTMDADGYIYVQDRIKDMIISGGENIYPAEVENVLYSHPAVADAAVIGIPDERWGETVKAMVVLKPGASATAEEIIAFCEGRIANFKRPKSVDFVTTLPRNPTGKVLKRELRKPYWEGRERAVN